MQTYISYSSITDGWNVSTSLQCVVHWRHWQKRSSRATWFRLAAWFVCTMLILHANRFIQILYRIQKALDHNDRWQMLRFFDCRPFDVRVAWSGKRAIKTCLHTWPTRIWRESRLGAMNEHKEHRYYFCSFYEFDMKWIKCKGGK